MLKYILAYCTTLAVLGGLDLLWLGVLARPLYQAGIGHLMADHPNVLIAVLFYLIFAAGLMFFSVAPTSHSTSWRATVVAAAVFGFVAYATYDLSNLATLKGWPTSLSLVDMAWGTGLSIISAAAGKAILNLTPVA